MGSPLSKEQINFNPVTFGYGPDNTRPPATAKLEGFQWWSTDSKVLKQVMWVGSLALYMWVPIGDPRDPSWGPTGTLAETAPRSSISGTFTQTSGTMYLYGGILLFAGIKYTAVNVYFTTAGATVTHTWAGLVRQSDRALLAVSPDTTAAPTLNTVRTFTFNTAYTPTVDTVAWIGLTLVAGTVPTVAATVAAPNAALLGLAPILAGSSTVTLTTPQALATVETAPTAITQVAYAYLT